jgi:hypothetical protein
MGDKAQRRRAIRLVGTALLAWGAAVGCSKTGSSAKKSDAGSGGASLADASLGTGAGGAGGSDADAGWSASGGTTVTSTGGAGGGAGGVSTVATASGGTGAASTGGRPGDGGSTPPLTASGGSTSSLGGAGRTGSGGRLGSGGAAGATVAPPETRDGAANPADAPASVNGIQDFCATWTETVCAIEVECCQARGFKASVEWCPVPSRPTYLVQQPVCSGKLPAPDNFDNAAAQACLDAQAQLFAGCAPARRDSAAHAAAVASCEHIAPKPLPTSGFCDINLGCAAPAGMVSVCYYGPGSGGIAECSAPKPPLGEGEPCDSEPSGCADGLVCGPARTCTPPLGDGQSCAKSSQCASGFCKDVCGAPPPIADSRCEELQQLASYALYMNVGNGTNVAVTKSRLVWIGYYGPGGEFLHHAPKDGSGKVVHLTPEMVHISTNVQLIADDDYVYDIDKGVVGRTSLADGSHRDLADVGFAGYLQARDGNDLIVVADYCSRMARVSVVDGSVALHPGKYESDANDKNPLAAVDDQAVYCANGTRITRFGRDGAFATVTQEAVSKLGWTVGLQALGGRLYYWAAGDSATDKGMLHVLEPSAGKITLVTPPSTPASLTIADPGKGLLLWASAGGIQQYAPASGTAVVVATPVNVGQPAFDEAYFYWINGSGLYRWPRP